MYTPILVTAPAALVTKNEAKAWLRVDSGDEDELIQMLVDAAISHLDGYAGILGRALVQQTWRQEFDCFAPLMRLPLPAVHGDDESVVVKWRNTDGQLSTVGNDNFTLERDGLGSFVRFGRGYSFPGPLAYPAAVSIDWLAGYGAATAVPAVIKLAIRMLVATWFEDRSMLGKLPDGVAEMLEPVRLRRIII
jgi:uncharacterized phiE125 gp8 family phage protein